MDTDLSDNISSVADSILDFLVVINLQSRKSGPATTSDKTSNVSHSKRRSRSCGVLGTAWSVPNRTDVVNSVSISVEADVIGGFVDKSGECGDHINIIDIGKM